MKDLSTFSEIYICIEPVDGRKQINTLSLLVESDLKRSPLDGSLYVFTNKRRDTVKLLYFDRSGFALWCKRLEKETFKWARRSSGLKLSSLSYKHLEMLLEGFDIFTKEAHKKLSFSRIS
ncbi:MAG: IS66 family insertion sequence element accessory protein TnpB [Proteobacteria bacterium]|nr:IS66 family insertion sequence element accessory protein TnpB [Pseudomonadota bacterium]